MREIKFRAWVGTGYAEDGNTSIDFKMTPPFTIFDLEDGVLMLDGEFQYTDLHLQSYTLMQYTGLKDKNGVEIYEGYVVRIPKGYVGDYSQPQCVKVVEWMSEDWDSEAGFYIPLPAGLRWSMCEVIGNIYENPELKEEHAG